MANDPSVGPLTAGTPETCDLARRFGGVTRLLGEPAHARLRAARIAVVGVGGVGSWAAEALARCGVERITLIDLDHVAESNANRQIQALEGEFGKAKVIAMAERIAAINPRAQVTCVEEFVSETNLSGVIRDFDLVLDCIDQVSAKAALIAHARAAGLALVTCGAAGGRTDPTRIRCADLARAAGDPLLAKVRYRLRRRHGFPRESANRRPLFGVEAVYSDEPVRRPVPGCSSAEVSDPAKSVGISSGLACAGYGSSVTVTAPLGFAAAARAIDRIVRRSEQAS
ncbi:MAG: tRNA threonylcarbamoyladenosine dehydratase [Burkholderiaceae bacterium]|nr:tRNA threonylcarbamoyladenosine dehydratase [Burkholderiaceae bacterium]